MCECASIRPGSSVIPGRSVVVVPGGTATLAAGLAAAIFSPETRTTQPSCVLVLTASNTRCGRRRMFFGAGGVAGGAAHTGANVASMPKATRTANLIRECKGEPSADILSQRGARLNHAGCVRPSGSPDGLRERV